MEVEAVTLTLEDKQPGSDANAKGDGAPKDPNPKDGNSGQTDAAKTQGAKPAPERKRARNLS